jgi:hypothetical protein
MRSLTLINNYLSWAMIFLFIITMLSGYSMTAKGDLVMKLTFNLINRKNGYFLHRKSSYLLAIFISFHVSINLRVRLLKMGFKDTNSLNLLILGVLAASIFFFTYIEFLW